MFHTSHFRLGTLLQVNYCKSKWTRALEGLISKPVLLTTGPKLLF